MITGEHKNKIDSLWDVFAAGGMDRTMLRISAMNMMVHGIEQPVFRSRGKVTLPPKKGLNQ